MAKISYKAHSAKIVKQLVCAAALAFAGAAQADVLNFEGSFDSPFVFQGDHIQSGNFWIESYGGSQAGDLVGAFVNGSDPSTCFGISCPVNNPSQYYTGIDDGYFYFGMNDDSIFRLGSLKASFIGNGQSSFPAVSGLLVLQGYDALGHAIGNQKQIPLYGPTNGLFNFSTYDLSDMTTLYSYVRVLGYSCDAAGNCLRNTNLSNFAIDDITTVPEPGTLALFGLGMAGLGMFARRRRAA